MKLPEAMGKDLSLRPDAAVFLDKPNEHVFSIINGTYVWLDNLLYEEELATRGHGGYRRALLREPHRRGGRLLRDRLSLRGGDVGSYWYTAWQQAGRPELK